MREYTDNLEATYNNLRSFKHDYINILSTLSIFLKEKRYSEMDEYFFRDIMPLKDEFTQNNASLANLSRVNNLELKSILYTKLLQAINKNITVTVDIADEMDSLNIDTIDLSRILGIYLDNAIEAAIETPHPVVNFHLGKVNSAVVFIISNSYVNHGISISQMAQMNTTSKGSGHGLGLYNVSKILSKHDNIFAETSMNDDLFTQQLQII
ncbi:sensor histidine kinase [Butyrivibrio sp. ob235]|uniref:sensor histidine kinase n=1 Tax=Butyrivibrio sp. ob235 TaxID=1761780 RepID=UPI0015879F96|nr:ATP-binding protein [Butyrivibrio sp. ob235]